MSRKFALLFLAVLLCSISVAQKKPLDPSTYEIWRSVRGITLSDDGRWVAYTLAPQEGDSVTEIKATDGSKTYKIDRASNFAFDETGSFAMATVLPKFEDTRKARRAKAKPEDMPKNGLTILNLSTGKATELERVSTYSVAPHDAGWIVYRIEAPKPEPTKAEAPKPPAPKEEAAKPEVQKPKPDHKAGDTWILRKLDTGKEIRLEYVTAAKWIKDGSELVCAFSTPDGSGDGIAVVELSKETRIPVAAGLGKYSKIAVCDSTKAVAFVSDKDDYQAKKPAASVYCWKPGDRSAAKLDLAALNPGLVPAESGSLEFSEKGSRLIFAVAPKPAEEKKDDTPDDEKVSVDIWNWQDKQMMPQQLMQAAADRARTYDAVADLDTGKVMQLETPTMRSVTIGAKGDGDYAIGRSDDAYQLQNTWGDTRTDFVAIDLRTGKTSSLATNFAGNMALSPAGRFVYGYDQEAKDSFVIDLRSGKRVSLTASVPNPLWDEENDTPSRPGSYGIGGWLPKDEGLLLYDRYDVWLVDPSGNRKARCLTNGVGRSTSTALRLTRLDPEQDFVDLDKPQVLTALNENSKAAGFYRLEKGELRKLIMEDKGFPSLIRARNAEIYAFQRMDVDQYPDVWVGGPALVDAKQFSEANPQQKDYNWLTAELVTWYSNDGVPLRGILYKPADFDPTKKYPMITYYYEKDSDRLHQYYSPAPSASTINISMYCSNGYLVFDPDISYKVGYPGESALSAILPGVQSILARGYVDPKRLGLQGQSWGGYETGYLVTETNMFAAACAGAPVSNMTSAYGGIRWESGVSREGQYEHGQSRIGGSLWEQPLRFIENSPIFFVDKIKTPLLIMSNDKDGAVPWYQGIEYFSALRRLNKPAWLVCYNEEQHNLVQRKNRKDWSVRMQQFFDHYLKGAPMPVWMAEGVPATMKGKTMGFELEKKKG